MKPQKLLLLFSIISLFVSSAQISITDVPDGNPIPIWHSIIPDTIFLSHNYESILIPSICQEYVSTNESSKKFIFYQVINDSIIETNSFVIYSTRDENCENISFPVDSLRKLDLNKVALLDKNQDYLTASYSLKKTRKIKELTAINKTEYTIKCEVEYKDSVVFSKLAKWDSDTGWKKINLIELYVWKLEDNSTKIVAIDLNEFYYNEEKVNVNSTKRTIIRL